MSGWFSDYGIAISSFFFFFLSIQPWYFFFEGMINWDLSVLVAIHKDKSQLFNPWLI